MSTSRIIVKNLPLKVNEKRLSELFASCGEITDTKIIRTRAGISRKFGYVGFTSDAQAQSAVQRFDRTFVGASRISVEPAKPYGDQSLERPWSKYSRGSSAFQQKEKARKAIEKQRGKEGVGKEQKEEVVKNSKKAKEQRLNQEHHKSKFASMLTEYYDLEDVDEFREFLDTHTHQSKVHTWADTAEKGVPNKRVVGENEKEEKEKKEESTDEEEEVEGAQTVKKTVEGGEGGGKMSKREKQLGSTESKQHGVKVKCVTIKHHKNEVSDGGSVTEEEEEERGSMEGGVSSCVGARSAVSDLDYLRSKMVGNATLDSDEEKREGKMEEEEEEEEDGEEEGNSEGENETAPPLKGSNEFSTTMFTLHMRGLPFRATQKDVETFFHPVSVADVRFTTDKDGRPSGRAYTDFHSKVDLDRAMERNGDCIGRRYIELFPDDGPRSVRATEEGKEKAEIDPTPWVVRPSLQTSQQNEENIADSGRLFLRNLSYTVTEEDLTQLFEKFGPLTEVMIPLDKTTNRPTGLGFVTFMLPEHAVKAFEDLDGQIFHGRLLHLLPSSSRSTKEDAAERESAAEGSSYKKKKANDKKSQAGSSHNWNTHFLGANAVVDAMAQRYSTTKSSILDPESGHSAAVRMALGETQLVAETREFLERNGVKLDVFEQRRHKRSTTVLLVKNLPHNTKQSELQSLFSPFGSLHRIILPPSGISALVEFLEPSHAKSAFESLAYSKFKHLPLYLEWAPLGVVEKKKDSRAPQSELNPKSDEDQGAEEKGEGEKKQEEEEGGLAGQQCTVFVKNLNFSTVEDDLRSVFSKIGNVKNVSVARKRDMKDPSQPLSMGFGFVEFSSPESAKQAVKDLQNHELSGHKLELKLSHRVKARDGKQGRRAANTGEGNSAKILVRNIPFEASRKEVRELFQTFGQLKTVRLPKKFAAQGEHRGFGFVEYTTKESAKRAFESLCQSTHLYGRRLVLEWAEEEESVEMIRKRTAEHFHRTQGPISAGSKRRKAEILLYGGRGSRGEED